MSLNVLQTVWAWILLWSGRYFRMLVSRPSGRSMRQELRGVDWPAPILICVIFTHSACVGASGAL